MLAKFPWERFYQLSLSFSVKSIWKICPRELGETLGVFVNTLTAAVKYPVQSFKNFQLQIQMQLSEKW